MSYNSDLQSNNALIQSLIDVVNELPEANNGIELPTMSTPATADEVFLGRETIGQNGEIQIGTFTINSELTTQNDLIAQIQSTVNGLPETGGTELPTLSNPATSSVILEGYEAIDGNGNVVTGTHVCEGGGGSSNDGASIDYFAIQVNYAGDIALYPFVPGMTWLDYCHNGPMPIFSINGNHEVLVGLIYIDEGDGEFYVCLPCIAAWDNSIQSRCTGYLLNVDSYNDTIISYLNNSHVYTLDWYPY